MISTWLDRRLRVLGNRTPRAAARGAGRRSAAALGYVFNGFAHPPRHRLGIRYDKRTAGYVYMPWLHDAAFLELYGRALEIEGDHWEGFGFTPRAYFLTKAAELATALEDGDFVECGVYKGGTAMLAAEMIETRVTAKPTFHLFDTFAGIPSQGLAPTEVALNRGGWLSDVSLEVTQKNLARYRDFTRYWVGYIPDTFQDFPPTRIRYLHVDINTAQAHRDCLEFFLPRLVEGAVVVLDDYGFMEFAECKVAVDACFREHGLRLPTALLTGQAFYVHTAGQDRSGPF